MVVDVPESCVFCDIVAGKFNTKFLYEDDVCVVFNDLKPMAPTHVLVVPRVHHTSLRDAAGEEPMLGRLLTVAAKVIPNGDFRVVVNNGAQAGQTVFHLHLHVLSGRHFGWPPG